MKEYQVPLSRSDAIYCALVTTFCVTLILSNVICSKLFAFPFLPSFALPAGLITYPLTFLLTDLVSEIWGAHRARYMVYLAFAMSFLMLAVIQLTVHLAPHEHWAVPGNPYGYADEHAFQTAFESVFSVNTHLVIGSLAAYLAAQLLDVSLYDWVRRRTEGRHLWLQNNVSTLLSQVVDTAIVGSVYLFWALKMDLATGLTIMLSSYLYKAAFALADTPFLYWAVAGVRARIREPVVGAV